VLLMPDDLLDLQRRITRAQDMARRGEREDIQNVLDEPHTEPVASLGATP